MRLALTILAGTAAGAALFFPTRALCAVLLKRRGREPQAKCGLNGILIGCMAAAGGLIAWGAGVSFRALYLFLLLAAAAGVSWTDITCRLIPNELVLAVIGLAALFGLTGATEFHIWSSLLGLAVCFAVFLAPALWKRSVGAGDVKLAAAAGFALGLAGSLYAMALMGGLILLFAMLERGAPITETLKKQIPMGPFLAAALVAVSAV